MFEMNHSGHAWYTCGMEAVGFKGVDIDGEAEGDQSGRSVPLSDDGSIVVDQMRWGTTEMEPTVAMCGYTWGWKQLGSKGESILTERQKATSAVLVSLSRRKYRSNWSAGERRKWILQWPCAVIRDGSSWFKEEWILTGGRRRQQQY